MKRILIIDDEKTVSAALTFALKKIGHQIIKIQNPLNVLPKLQEDSFDLIILDYNLTLLSGTDVLKLIKNNNIKIPSVIISANKANEIINNEFTNKNSTIYISKDQPISEIINKIEEILLLTNLNQYRGGSYAEN